MKNHRNLGFIISLLHEAALAVAQDVCFPIGSRPHAKTAPLRLSIVLWTWV
jgi:hypothetical protein